MDYHNVLRKFDELVESGVIFYDPDQKIICYTEDALDYRVILTPSLHTKPTLDAPQHRGHDHEARKRPGSDISTEGFEIGTIGDTHILIANRFCYARPHLMLLTLDGHCRQFEALNVLDFSATWSLLAGSTEELVAFFNCGREGGCSRLHKHVQLMPKPQQSFANFLDLSSCDIVEPKVPFQWFFHQFHSDNATPESLVKTYRMLLDRAALAMNSLAGGAQDVPPHNMILSRNWMIVIPRRRGMLNAETGVNALGMLGIIAVAKEHEMHNWASFGFANALRMAGLPATSNVNGHGRQRSTEGSDTLSS